MQFYDSNWWKHLITIEQLERILWIYVLYTNIIEKIRCAVWENLNFTIFM